MKYVLILVLFCCTQTFSAPPEKFRIVTENYPPYNMSSGDNSYEHKEKFIQGISTDIVKEMFRRIGYGYSLKLRNWDYAYNFAQRKAYRGVYSTTFTEARKPLFKWVGPLANNEWTFFAKRSSGLNINSLEDVKPLTIGSYQGDVMSNWLIDNGYNASELDDDTLNPQRLENGQIDLWLTDTNSGFYWSLKAGIKVKPAFSFRKTELYLAMNPDTPDEYIDAMNEVLDKMREEGFFDRAFDAYR